MQENAHNGVYKTFDLCFVLNDINPGRKLYVNDCYEPILVLYVTRQDSASELRRHT